MGQEQKQPSSSSDPLKPKNDYDMDPHLIENKTILPSYFSTAAEKIIQEISKTINQIPHHPIEHYLIKAIDVRFDKTFTESSSNSQKNTVGQDIEWHQLSDQKYFFNLLNTFAKQYATEKLIQSEFQSMQKKVNIEGEGQLSLRSPLKPASTPVLSQELIIRMLLRIYQKLIKTYANSGQKHIMRFHEKTGSQLCLMILKSHLQLMEIYGMFYQFVYIDKHPSKIENKLALIHKNYHWKCLRTQYTINVEQKQLQKLQKVARLYLDQLYLSSLREAQDPEIKNSDDSLLPIKIFPISRVKDKPRP